MSPKYKNLVFKYATITGWEVLVSGPQLTSEVAKAPDGVLSMDIAMRQVSSDVFVWHVFSST